MRQAVPKKIGCTWTESASYLPGLDFLVWLCSCTVVEIGFLDMTRRAYNAKTDECSEVFRDPLADQPLDRAVIHAFAELVKAGGAVPVADLGCGPGHYTAYLHSRGVPVFGVDLSPQMIELACREYPGIRFEVGSMLELELPDGSVGGVSSHYSIIHTPPERVH